MTNPLETTIKVGLTHSPYNRMMIRDVSLVILAGLIVLGVIVLLAIGRQIPGELWGVVGTLTGAIVGAMGKYNGHDSGINPPKELK